jgi:regulator of protease activity HflC (stomatin/prohibitin superfamily)
MPTKITIELPQTLTKEEAIEILKREALKKKFKRTELFEKYSKNKDVAYKIADYVEKYLKRYYKGLKFEILLDYDLDDDINIIRVFIKDIDLDKQLQIEEKLDKMINSKFENASLHNIVIVEG